MQNRPIEIIDNEILTLFKEEEENKLNKNEIIDFVSPIIKEIIWSVDNNSFSNLRTLVNDFFGILTENTYTYCKKLDSSYKKNQYNCFEVKIQIVTLLRSITDKPKESRKLLDTVLQVLEENKKALNYFANLSILSREKKNLLISYRTAGWNTRGWNLFGKKIQISEELVGVVYTNFGYGNSSHFYVLFTYKNIPISTYTDYIKYEFVKSHEIIRYTRKYHYYNFREDEFGNIYKSISIDYNGWSNLMNYILDVSNIPNEEKENFFFDYINKEFTMMVKKLEEMQHSDQFNFLKNIEDENGNISEQSYLVGLKERLLSYKTEKIFGSIDFFASFTENFKIENEHSIIKLFELYNFQFPNLVEEVEHLEKILPEYEEKLGLVQKRFNTYLKDNNTLRRLLNSKLDFNDLNEEDEMIFKDYLEEKQKLLNSEKNLDNLKNTIRRAVRYKKDYTNLKLNFSI